MPEHRPHRASHRRPRRVAALGAGLAAVLALLAVPAARDARADHATDRLREQLGRVVAAEAAFAEAHGSFSASLDELGVTGARAELAIVSAGPDGYCAGAYDGRTRTALFYSPAGGFSPRACS
ncbi:hypothetical protein [Kineococcus sp. SYSU DK002]|uniref:hypothetical protein n=1 Tax=Kineococcus sp. SYSU DK002 TaxID=3383123 RepID=UPI003D7EFB58